MTLKEIIMENTYLDFTEDEVKEMIKDKIRSYVGNYAYNCYCKDWRRSDEWMEMDLSEKFRYIAKDGFDIDDFIEHLIN